MEQKQFMVTPPVEPLTPVVPPPQTVMGILSHDGQPSIFETKLAGQAPNQDFWFARDELVGSINMNTTQASETQLAHIDILQVSPNSNNPSRLPIRQGSGPPAGSYPISADNWNITLPRTIALNSACYFNGPIVLTFWAIKPAGTRGKIRFTYNPFFGKGLGLNDLSVQTNIPFTPDPFQRQLIWSWDLEKQDIFTLEFHGNNPISTFPTNDHNGIGIIPANEFSNKTFRPVMNTTYGSLFMYVQNRYTPGSIFPSNFNIYVFKSMPGTKLYVERGPRVWLDRIVI